MRRHGFTILELMVTLALIALVATLAIPAYFARSEVTLESAVQLMIKDLRTAQNRAAYLGQETTITFLEDGAGYRASDPSGFTIVNPRDERAFERRFSSDAVFEGVQILEVTLGGPLQNLLVFDERGRVLQGGTITLSFDGDQRTLQVEDDSGFVSIVEIGSGR